MCAAIHSKYCYETPSCLVQWARSWTHKHEDDPSTGQEDSVVAEKGGRGQHFTRRWEWSGPWQWALWRRQVCSHFFFFISAFPKPEHSPLQQRPRCGRMFKLSPQWAGCADEPGLELCRVQTQKRGLYRGEPEVPRQRQLRTSENKRASSRALKICQLPCSPLYYKEEAAPTVRQI